METYLSLTVIVIAIALIGIILLQVRGQGAGLFGSAQTSFRTRRGVDLILYRFTIFLASLFILMSLISILSR